MSITLEDLTASVTVDMRRGRRKFAVNVALAWDEVWWVTDVYPPDGVTLTLAERRRCCRRATAHVKRVLAGAVGGNGNG